MKASIVLKQNRDEEQADPTNFWNSSLPMHWSPPRRCLRFQPFRAKFYESQQSFMSCSFTRIHLKPPGKATKEETLQKQPSRSPRRRRRMIFFCKSPHAIIITICNAIKPRNFCTCSFNVETNVVNALQ